VDVKDLDGKVAVVTGGGSGIGRATGALLARQGMKVVLADVDAGRLDATVAECRAESLDVMAVTTDVSDFQSMQALAAAAYDVHGAVHLVHLNAGIGGGGSFFDDVTDDWQRVIGVNLLGVIWGIKAFVPRMLEAGEEGCILATSSGAGAEGTAYNSGSYAATKIAVVSIMESLYGQLRDRGSRLEAALVFPPLTASNLAGDPATMKMVESHMQSQGLPVTMVEPEQVAAMVLDGVRRGRFFIRAGPAESKAFYDGRITEEYFEWSDRVLRGRAEAQLADSTPEAYLW
jgi:NAD(P)-dependent dehydrogenase (short-subunit alcohol dehydrogenase family)